MHWISHNSFSIRRLRKIFMEHYLLPFKSKLVRPEMTCLNSGTSIMFVARNQICLLLETRHFAGGVETGEGSATKLVKEDTDLSYNPAYFAALIKCVVPWSQPWTGISIIVKYSFSSFSFISFSGSVKKWTFKSSNRPRSLLTSGMALISVGENGT